MRINEINKKSVYDNLFIAGQYYYEMKDLLIELRQEAAWQIDVNTANAMKEDELSEVFIRELDKEWQIIKAKQ